MRTKNYLLVLVLATLFFLPSLCKAQEGDDPVFALEIRLKHGPKVMHNYEIYLSYKGSVVDTVSIKHGKEVYVTLQKDKEYSFLFHKEGYIDKQMDINTSLPPNVSADNVFVLSFDIEMIANDPTVTITPDLPFAAYVQYDSKSDDFSLYQIHRE